MLKSILIEHCLAENSCLNNTLNTEYANKSTA